MKNYCQACRNNRYGVFTRISVQHTCTKSEQEEYEKETKAMKNEKAFNSQTQSDK